MRPTSHLGVTAPLLHIEYPGARYHLTSRGDGREDIFLDDRDRFLKILREVSAPRSRAR